MIPPLPAFHLGGHTYRARPVTADDARRMCRLLLAAAPHLRVMVPVEKRAAEGLVYVEVLSRAVDAVPERDRAWIGSACLSTIERRSGLRWRPVWDAARHRTLYGDLADTDRFLLIVRVLHEVAAEYLNERPPA